MDNFTNFGITDTQELLVGEGQSALFADSSDIEEITQEEPQEEPKQAPPKKSGKKVDESTEKFAQDSGSALFSDEDEEDEPEEEEKPKPKKKEVGIPEPQAENESEEDEVSEFEEYAQQMFKAGIFSELEGDDQIVFDSEEKLRERFNTEKTLGARKILQDYLGSKGEKARLAFEAIIDKGIDPEVYYQKTTRIDRLEEADLEDVETQESVVRTYYEAQGFKPEVVNKKLTKIKEYDDLADEAQLAKDFLLDLNKKELAQEEQIAQQKLYLQQQAEQEYLQSVHNTLNEAISKKEIKGIPVSQKVAAEVFDLMTQKRWRVDGREITEHEKMLIELKDPKNIEKAILFTLLNRNNFDLSSVKKSAISEESSNIFKTLKKKTTTNKRKESPAQDSFFLY